jgi:hypothetical protein
MTDDIVKNILIRLKVDDKDVKRMQDALTKKTGGVATGSSGSGASSPNAPGGINDTVKKILEMSRELDRIGVKTSKSWDKVSQAAKNIAKDYLKESEKQLDAISRKVELKIRALDRLKRMGASEDVIKKQESRISQAVGMGQEKLSEVRGLSQLVGSGGGGGISSALGGPMGIAQLVAAVAGGGSAVVRAFQQAQATNAQYTGSAGSLLVGRKIEAREGNLLTSIMNVKNRQDEKAMSYAKSQLAKEDAARALTGVAGLAGGVAAMLGAGATGAKVGAAIGSVFPGLGTLAGGIVGSAIGIGGAALAGSSALNTAKYFLNPGDRESFRLAKFQEGVQIAQAQSIDPYIYNQFRAQQGQTYQTNRLLQMGDSSGFAMRMSAINNMMDPQQIQQMALGFRGRFGNMAAADMATQSSFAAIQLGLSQQGAQQAIGRLGFAGQGGTQQARDNLEKIMSAGLAKGIEDSGLLERVTELVTAYQESQSVATQSGRIAQEMLSGVGPDVNARTIEAAASAQQALSNMFNQGGYRGFEKMRGIQGFMAKQGINSTDFLLAASGMSREELLSEQGMQVLGITDPGAQEQFRSMLEETGKSITVTSREGRGKIEALRKKKQRGQPITEQDIMGVAMTMVAQDKMSPDQAASAARMALTREGILDQPTGADLDAFKSQQEAAARGGTAEAKAESARFRGMGATEKDIQGLRTNMDSYIEEFNKQMEATKDFGQAVDLTVDGVKKLSDALDKLTKKIEQINAQPIGPRGAFGARASATLPATNE